MGLHTQNASKVGNSLDELSSKKKGLSSYLGLECSYCGTLDTVDVGGYNLVDIKICYNFDRLPVKIMNVAESGKKKDSAAELSKAVMLLMRQCQSGEHGNNVDFLW